MFQWAGCRSVHKTLQSLFLVSYHPPSFPVYPLPVAKIPFCLLVFSHSVFPHVIFLLQNFICRCTALGQDCQQSNRHIILGRLESSCLSEHLRETLQGSMLEKWRSFLGKIDDLFKQAGGSLHGNDS